MIKVGEHLTLDFLGVKKDYTPEFYEKIIYTIAKAAKVEILNVASHRFQPQGFTLVALLAESHFSFHTFPEKGVISWNEDNCVFTNQYISFLERRNSEFIFHIHGTNHIKDDKSKDLWNSMLETALAFTLCLVSGEKHEKKLYTAT